MPKLTYTVAGAQKVVDVTDSCSIGRVAGNTIALEDETGASRRHCQILKIKDGFELTDVGSTNGTKVNGAAVKRHKLRDGDRIEIGQTLLVWSEGAVAAATADDEILLEEPEGSGPARTSAASQASDQCFLVHSGGPKDGQKLALDKKRVTFGRNPKNTCVVDDSMASGYHCEIAREGGAWLLRDLGSTNGTLVDGEPVTEMALAHGARIRIGGTRLVFIDPTVSDFEKAMSAVEDLGSEWGLLRAEMDMSRVQKARRSQAIAIGALVVILAGAGYVAVAHPELLSPARKPLVNVADNMVGDFSFDELTGTWSAAAGSPVQGRFADANDGPAAQGVAYYAVSRDGPSGRAAYVEGGESFLVDPNRAYRFGAKIRAKNGGWGVVRVAWLASDGRSVLGRSSTDAVSAGDWTESLRTVSQPPRNATRARLELANVGGGTCYFDDLVFAPGTRPAASESVAGDLAWRVAADGQATLTRGPVVLLHDAVVVGGALRADLDDARRPDRVGGTTGVSVSGGGMSGRAIDPAGEAAEFSVTGTAVEGRYLDLSGTLPPHAAIVARLAPEIVDEGIGVRVVRGEFFRLSDVRTIDKVQSVSFGDRNRFEVSATEGGSFRMALLRTEEGWSVAFAPEESKLNLRIDTDTRALTQAVDALSRAAPDAVNARRYGDAVKLLNELAGRLPAGNAQAEAARQQAEALDRQGRTRLDDLRAGVAAGIEFNDDAALTALEEEAKSLASQYAGHEVGAGAEAEAARMRQAAAGRALALAERRAAPFLLRADDYASRGARHLAEALYRGVAGAYPGTESAKKAQAGLDRLRSEK